MQRRYLEGGTPSPGRQFIAEAMKCLDTDDEAGAGNAGGNAEQLAASHWFVVRDKDVKRNAKIGVVEFRIAASPASTVRSAQAINGNGIAKRVG
ncbi:hypothetical protein AJ87_46965 [Rhizobium yanglingense]|nr:hypothetical protein AJ87_46965 [Rhizobium yanglingense]